MKTAIGLVAALTAVAMVAAPAWAGDEKAKRAGETQQQPAASPGMAAPDSFEGEIISIDQASGMLTVRFSDGTTQEFRGSAETLREYKVGDKISGTKRADPTR